MNSRGKPVASGASRPTGDGSTGAGTQPNVARPGQASRYGFVASLLEGKEFDWYSRPPFCGCVPDWKSGSPRPDEAEKERRRMGIDLLGIRGKKRLESP
ncbi:hypothetical protein M9X92_002724 [Pyricularia oryzae]|nr:hypothetical protein M9X92_002724 [Pyricularia oryzae]